MGHPHPHLAAHARKASWILIAALPRIALAADTSASEAVAPVAADAAADTMGCAGLRAAAQREESLAYWPEVESSIGAQAEPLPSKGLDRTRTRVRVGLAYDVAAIARAGRAAELAALGCRMDSQGSVGLEGALARLRAAALQSGYHARRTMLQRALDEEQTQGQRLEEAHKRGLVSLKNLDEQREVEHELAMALATLDPLVRPRATGQTADEPGLGDESVRAALARARGDSRRLLALRTEHATPPSWQLRVGGGYEALSQTEGDAAIPAYFAATMVVRLGALSPLDGTTAEAIERAESMTIAQFEAERAGWQRQLDLSRRRLDSLGRRIAAEGAASPTVAPALRLSSARMEADVAELSARLGAAPEAPSRAPAKDRADAQVADEKTKVTTPALPELWSVTSGTVSRRLSPMAGVDLPYTTSSPTMRLYVRQSETHDVAMSYRAEGSVPRLRRLASGLMRRQLGVFLAGIDQCNLLYVMVRSEGSGAALAVQSKTNKGQSTHEQCGNRGYTTLRPRRKVDLPSDVLKPGTTHRLAAQIATDGALRIHMDGALVWEGEVPEAFRARSAQPGVVGLRSDNMEWSFALENRP